MKVKIYLVFILATISLQFAVAKPPEADTVKRDHLLVKMNMLIPIQYIVSSDGEGYMLGLSMEYKTKKPLGFQLTTYYDHGLILDNSDNSLEISPEFRYYMNHHFTGLYYKFQWYNMYRVLPSERVGHWTEKFQAIGAFYGYQREFGRLVLEGQIGVGVRYNIGDTAREYNYPYFPEDLDPMIDLILGLYAGWRIF
jgi:hypothetical protein